MSSSAIVAFSAALLLLLLLSAGGARGRMYKKCELARELRHRHGLPDHQISTWVCIAKHESDYNTSAINRGSGDHGMFQISDIYWCSVRGVGKTCGKACWDFEDDDITDDVECVKRIFREHARMTGDGFTAWAVYPSHCRGDTSSYIAGCFDQPGNAAQEFGHGLLDFGGFAPQSTRFGANSFHFAGDGSSFGRDTSFYAYTSSGDDASNFGVGTTSFGSDSESRNSFGKNRNQFQVNRVLTPGRNYKNGGSRFRFNAISTPQTIWGHNYQGGYDYTTLPNLPKARTVDTPSRNVYFYKFYPQSQEAVPRGNNYNGFIYNW